MWYAIFGTSSGHRFHFILPASFVEIGSKKVAGVVVEQRIQADNLLSCQVAIDDQIV